MGRINLGELHVESSYRLKFTIKKDGASWVDIDSVELTFEKPDRTTSFTRDMVLDSGAVWYYDVTVTDLDRTGIWTLKVKIIDGTIVSKYPQEIIIEVKEQP